MPRYIDAELAIELKDKDLNWVYDLEDLEDFLAGVPTADVVPKSEHDKLEYTLIGVMHSVDKWLDGEELERDEVNRAITMREKTLGIIENIKAEVAREIFDELETVLCRRVRPTLNRNGTITPVYDDNVYIRSEDYDAVKKRFLREGE